MRDKYRDLGIKLYQELPAVDNRLKLAEGKLYALLKEVELVVKIKTVGQNRAYQLIDMIRPALA